MKRNLLKPMLALLLVLMGGMNVMALETYDFQALCMAIGKGGPWAVNDGGDAGFTINDATMHYLGDYTEQGFSWNGRFAYEYVAERGKFTMRNKNNKKDKNCGMFSWDYTHKFSILDLKDGDKVTITTLAGTTSFVSTNVTAEVNEGDVVASGTAYTISTTEETTRLDIEMAAATLISKIEIEPFGVETVPVITVTPKTLKLIPTATAKLTATVSPAADTQWTSSDESIVTVDAEGNVTAIAAGTATITNSWKSEISDATASDACVITVADVDLSAYTIVKSYDFTAMGDVTLELNSEAAGAIWNDANSKNNNVFFCTNEGLEDIAVQAAVSNNKGWSIVDGQGLLLASGAGRCAAVGNIKAGQIVEFIYTGNGFYTKSDGTDDGIAKTALNEGTGRAIYQADADGMIGFELIKGNAVQQINIYSNASEATLKTIALAPGVWETDGAVFAAYAFNDEGNAWFPFVKVGDGSRKYRFAAPASAYVAQVPDTYTGIIAVRLKPATADGYNAENDGLNWDNKWNQTDDIDFTTVNDGSTITITGWETSDYTIGDASANLDDLKDKLGKAIAMADLFDLDTTAAAAALANTEATEADLTAALTSLVTDIVPKAQETITLARKFFEKFDGAAGAALEPYFAAAETALGGTDFQAMYEAAMALFAQGLVEGQRAMAKVSGYLEKMENETVNTDLAAINTAVAANDLNAVLAALRQMKDDLPDAAQAYAVQVQTLIDEGEAAGNDVSGMKTALSSVMTAYLQYKMKKADLVDVGYALYQLIKAVEEYKAAQAVVSYYLVGTMTNWVEDGVNEEYKLTLNTEAGEGVEEYMISLDLTTADRFKIVKKDGDSYVWYPDGTDNDYGQSGEITADGNYTVYFRPNADGGDDWFWKVIYVEANSTDHISAVNIADQNVVIFNLSGQRVMKAQKGLYIVNGKKVILK